MWVFAVHQKTRINTDTFCHVFPSIGDQTWSKCQLLHENLCDIHKSYFIKRNKIVHAAQIWCDFFYMQASERVRRRWCLAQWQETDTPVSSGCWEWQKQGPQNRLWRKKGAMVQILRPLKRAEERREHNRVMSGGLASSSSIDNEFQTHVTQIEFDVASGRRWQPSKWCRRLMRTAQPSRGFVAPCAKTKWKTAETMLCQCNECLQCLLRLWCGVVSTGREEELRGASIHIHISWSCQLSSFLTEVSWN